MHATASRCNILGEKNGIRFVSLASRDAIVIETPITDLIARATRRAANSRGKRDRPARAERIVGSFASSRARDCVIALKDQILEVVVVVAIIAREPRSARELARPKSPASLRFQKTRGFSGERDGEGHPVCLRELSPVDSSAGGYSDYELRMKQEWTRSRAEMFAEDSQDLKVIAISLTN